MLRFGRSKRGRGQGGGRAISDRKPRRCAALPVELIRSDRFCPQSRVCSRDSRMANQLFARKSIETLVQEMEGENRLHRVLGPISLTSLGVGAIIGAGIFAMTGQV